MSTDDPGQSILSTAITGPISAEEVSRYFSPRSNLTYRRFVNLEVSDANVHQSLFTGSLISDCVFTRVTFTRSDLDGLRIEGSTFIDCDLSSCDYRSSIFARCTFHACNFNTSFIDDCEFQECELDNCSFSNSSLTHCRFQNSSLSACNFTPGTLLHNKLYNSTISDTILGDCTLLYVILRDCKLTRVSINAESIGAIFGLTREQLAQADMVYLGEEEPIPPGTDILSLISEEYHRRKWHIGQLVLAVNFGLASTINAFDDYLSLSYKRFTEFGFAKGEELEFLGDLLQELAFLERLPLLTALNVLEWCTALEAAIIQSNLNQPESAGDSLRTLASRVAILTNALLDRLDNSLPQVESGENDRRLCIKATFQEKPALPLADFLNSLASTSALDAAPKSHLVRVEKGSYVEIVITTISTIIAFQVVLFLINGCVIQLTELKHRAKVLARKKAPRNYRNLVLSTSQQASPLMLSILPILVGHVKSLPWLKDQSLSGYKTSNIKSLQEVQCEDSKDDSEEI